jgi:hypothetical protein
MHDASQRRGLPATSVQSPEIHWVNALPAERLKAETKTSDLRYDGGVDDKDVRWSHLKPEPSLVWSWVAKAFLPT